MENTITLDGFAYERDDVKLFPLCAKNADGSVNKFETMLLIQEAMRMFGKQSQHIPSDRIAAVLSQIEGAAISHGLALEVTA